MRKNDLNPQLEDSLAGFLFCLSSKVLTSYYLEVIGDCKIRLR